MKIAILGSVGYLGAYLYRYLSGRHYELLPVTRSTLDLENYIQVEQWLSKNTPDVVINCAINGGGKRVNDINYTDVQRDLAVFLNFYNSNKNFKYINIGSGAEFDRNRNIDNAEEADILYYRPLDSYGFTKNTIARMILNRDNFYTLRLFGCFDPSESDIRLFKKFLKNETLPIEDKFFDYISLKDFSKIVEAYCLEERLPKDINCVYTEKFKLSEILQKLSPGTTPTISGLGKSYTGSGQLLSKLNMPLDGLQKGLEEYV